MSKSISQSDLLGEIHRLADELGHRPTLGEMDDHGSYSPTTYYDNFESWTAAVEQADVDAAEKQQGTSKDDLLAEIHRLADELEKTPTIADLKEHGEYSTQPYYSTFDGWKDAVEQAGLEREKRQQGPSREELLEAIVDLYEDIGETPTKAQMNDRGRFSTQPYYNKFDGWNDALERVDLETNHENDVPKEALLDELQRAAEELGRSPTLKEATELTEYHGATYAKRFGSWLEAREEAGLSGEWEQWGRRAEKHDLLEELRRLGDELGRAPAQGEMREDGMYSAAAYHTHFGGFIEALKAAGYELDETSREWPIDYPDDWDVRRERVRRMDDYQCVDCSITEEEHKEKYGEQLHVHHVYTEDGDPDDIENLVTLCKGCHAKWDRVKTNPRTVADE